MVDQCVYEQLTSVRATFLLQSEMFIHEESFNLRRLSGIFHDVTR